MWIQPVRCILLWSWYRTESANMISCSSCVSPTVLSGGSLHSGSRFSRVTWELWGSQAWSLSFGSNINGVSSLLILLSSQCCVLVCFLLSVFPLPHPQSFLGVAGGQEHCFGFSLDITYLILFLPLISGFGAPEEEKEEEGGMLLHIILSFLIKLTCLLGSLFNAEDTRGWSPLTPHVSTSELLSVVATEFFGEPEEYQKLCMLKTTRDFSSCFACKKLNFQKGKEPFQGGAVKPELELSCLVQPCFTLPLL